MRVSEHTPRTRLPEAVRPTILRIRALRPTRLPTLIHTTATGRYLQRLQWLFGGS